MSSVWHKKLEKLKTFIKKEGRLPRPVDDRVLFHFMCRNVWKVHNKDPFAWEEMRQGDEYGPYFVGDLKLLQEEYLQPVIEHVEKHGAKPSKRDAEGKRLLKLWRFFKNRYNHGCYVNREETYGLVREFARDPRIQPLFGRKPEGWIPRLDECVTFMEANGHLPPSGSPLRRWYDRQVRECKSNNPLYPDELVVLWESFMESELFELAAVSSDEEL